MDINTLIFSQERVSLSADESKIPWDNRCDISYTPTQRGILLFEAARDVLKKRGKKWFTVKTPPNPLRVSDAMAHRLARKSTAFMPQEQ
ncbi:hypothetical protein ABL006_004055 [Salmonella enterica]